MPFSPTAKKLFSVLVTLVFVAIAVYAIHWLFVYYTESPWTRDGRIRADVYQVAPDVTGRIVEMAVSDNQKVSKGDLLFAIDPASYEVALARAEADASSAQADLAEKRLEAERRRKLGPDMISKEERDKSELTLKAGEAQYRAAESLVNKARLDLARTPYLLPRAMAISPTGRGQKGILRPPGSRCCHWSTAIAFMFTGISWKPSCRRCRLVRRRVLRY